MAHFQPRRRIYFGQIILGDQPINWIRKHRSFASREWFESQVRYGTWIKERNRLNHFLIYATVTEGIKPIKILIKIKHSDTYVLIYHAHVFKKR